MSHDGDSLCTQICMVVDTCHVLALLINWVKSHFEPSQRVQFSGAISDATLGRAFLPLESVKALKSVIQFWHRKCWQPVKIIQRFLSLMASTMAIVPYSRLHMSLQFWVSRRYGPFIVVLFLYTKGGMDIFALVLTSLLEYTVVSGLPMLL